MDEMPGAEDWGVVGDAIREQMGEPRMSKADLARQTGLSTTTSRYLGRSRNGHRKPTLIAVSVVLRWRHDHLLNLLRGQPEKNVHARPPGLANLERLMRAEVGGPWEGRVLLARTGPMPDEIRLAGPEAPPCSYRRRAGSRDRPQLRVLRYEPDDGTGPAAGL